VLLNYNNLTIICPHLYLLNLKGDDKIDLLIALPCFASSPSGIRAIEAAFGDKSTEGRDVRSSIFFEFFKRDLILY
jgi:hypothetical protein